MDVVRAKVIQEFTEFMQGHWRHYKPGDVAEIERTDAAPFVARGLMLIEGDPLPAVKIVGRQPGKGKRAVK